MRRPDPLVASTAALAGVVALCCAFPVLLTLGLLGTVLGWTLNSWVLVGFGAVVAGVGLTRAVRRRRRDDQSVADSATVGPP